MLISVASYAEKHGYKPDAVRDWAKRGLLEGSVKQPIPPKCTSYMYMIPEDANPPSVRASGRPRMKFGLPEKKNVPDGQPEESRKTVIKGRTSREISLFIRKHCGNMTYREMSRALDISTLEVRAIYDRLHARYGI